MRRKLVQPTAAKIVERRVVDNDGDDGGGGVVGDDQPGGVAPAVHPEARGGVQLLRLVAVAGRRTLRMLQVSGQPHCDDVGTGSCRLRPTSL